MAADAPAKAPAKPKAPKPAAGGDAKPAPAAVAPEPAVPTPAKPAPAPGAPAAPTAAKPVVAAAPAQPTGDAATLAGQTPGASYAVLEDGTGVVTVPADELFTAARRVKSMGYRVLSVLSAYDRGDHFGVLYAFLPLAERPEQFKELRLRVVLPKTVEGKPVEPECPSLVDVYPAADWHEREMFDMYGIRFLGHPDLRRMFLPDGWAGYPMRKDYKEPEQFVALRDGEDIVVRKPQEGAW